MLAFVCVLSYSRRIFLRFYLDQRLENFLRGYVAAFAAWHGLPRVLIYDNLKSAVLDRRGDAILFNPTLVDFAKHYRFDLRSAAVARGDEKGRVERAIRADVALAGAVLSGSRRPARAGAGVVYWRNERTGLARRPGQNGRRGVCR